jgi:hypothetical protein
LPYSAHAPRADHLDVVVHHAACTGGVADFDQAEQFAVHVLNALHDLAVQRRIAPRPRHVLQRNELHHQHAVVRGLGDGEMKRRAQLGKSRRIAECSAGLVDERAQSGQVRFGGVFGGEFRGQRLDRALRVHDLGRPDAGEVELHRQRLREQPRIAARHPRPAALAHFDFGDAERLQGAQRIARDDPRHAVALSDLVLGADAVAGLEFLGEQRIAHVGDDLRGQRRRTAGKEHPAGQRGGERVRFAGHGCSLGPSHKLVKILS